MASFKQLPPEFRFDYDERKRGRPPASAKGRAKRVDQDAMDTTKLLKEEGVENVMEKLGGKKQKDGSYTFNNEKTVKKSTGGLINGRPTGKGKGAARSI